MSSVTPLMFSQANAGKAASGNANNAGKADNVDFGNTLAREMGQDKVSRAIAKVEGRQRQDDGEMPQDSGGAGREAAEAWLAMLQFGPEQTAAAQIQVPVVATAQGETDPVTAMKAWLAGAVAKGEATDPQQATETKADTATSQADLAATGKGLPQVEGLEAEEAPQDTAPETLARPLEAPTPTTQRHGETQAANAVKPSHYVPEPVGSNRWGDAVAQRVAMMLGRQEQQIEMQLNPPHLGPMEVRLSLSAENASVVFASQHAGVREALAAATPRLTALLADQGIQLVDVKVASDSLNQQAQQQAFAQQQQSGNGRAPGDERVSYDGVEGQAQVETQVLNGVALQVARSGLSAYA
ncbi:hypothetical protein GCM10007860_23970 [Chitiniphilus shinanonensis]|uniref:Flagellar hook-length control protein-like C-terminal domain-containing protein n=1 Tax=Chitiniphilus shinanonensis TaxID=553088 RepID=A0ABQ6BUW8_9NEIS|nr:flagellar hook-length control protein FliK [Chitiniphilus shinanonensis]GLS05247.1 hypothetical protein GCM10007860_23970 [Chitiniphilus shinanonensis]